MKINRLPEEDWIINKNSINLLLGYIESAKNDIIYWDKESKKNNYSKKYEDSYIKAKERYKTLLFMYNWIEGKQPHKQIKKGKINNVKFINKQ
tara:strand:- start:1537 stop:1815 length:279 start_codon:yes stop_codon:yes gene_type:complete